MTKNRKKTLATTLAFCLSILMVYSKTKQESALVHKTTSKITVDGVLEEEVWKSAEVFTFDNYYNAEKPSDKQKTKFRMLWDDENLYLFYECEDAYITAREKNRDGAPYNDDCAEIFLIPVNDVINFHFGYEINLYKVANDFVFLNNYYKKDRLAIKAYNPEYQVAVKINGTLNDNSDTDKGWNMEVAIPIKAFHTAGQFTPVSEGTIWRFMALRQERNEIEGERRTASTMFPIHPQKIDVHDPKYFGLLKFVP